MARLTIDDLKKIKEKQKATFTLREVKYFDLNSEISLIDYCPGYPYQIQFLKKK